MPADAETEASAVPIPVPVLWTPAQQQELIIMH